MRIGIDVRPLSRAKTGIFRYLTNILGELQKADGENTYYLYSDQDFGLTFENERWHRRIRSRFRFLPGSLWLQTDAKRLAVEDGLDVFWGPAHALPLGLPAMVKKVLTVHDVVWRAYPETMSTYNRLVHRLLVDRSIRQADVLLVPSESAKADVAEYLGIKKATIRAVYNGVDRSFYPRDPAPAARHIAQKFQVSKEYICGVGTIEPRKNLVTLVEAFQILRKKHRFRGQLLIAGERGWGKSNIYRRMSQLGLTEKDVKFLGFVPEEDMPMLYSGALVFVFPSLYEGFGLPLVEAMACGAPVVASNVSSIPEVVGGAAVLVPPQSPEEFAAAILRVGADPELRAALTKQGLERAQCFRWQVAAQEVLKAFRCALPTATIAATSSDPPLGE
jgi:glycosyltransferase involved in cell wall biosynthesis